MPSIACTILFHLVHCADFPPGTTINAKQTLLMHKATFLFPGGAKFDVCHSHACKSLWYAMTKVGMLTKVCEYNGVECTDGVVRSLFLAYRGNESDREAWAVRLAWLPPTVEHIHLTAIKLHDGIASESLPRALRYFFVQNCMWQRFTRRENFLDFRKLPPHLEEFILDKGSFSGDIVLDALPQSMSFLFLRVMQRIEEVHVDKAALPAGMKHLALRHAVDGRLMRPVVEGQSACLIDAFYDWAWLPKDSRYYARFQALV